MRISETLKYDSQGLIPAVIQDHANGQVLMVGYMNREAVDRTIDSGRATFWSRSRGKYWVKGETSGHIQVVREVRVDCDLDCLLVLVEQVGPACHEGYRSCFFRKVSVTEEMEITESRWKTPEEIYGTGEKG